MTEKHEDPRKRAESEGGAARHSGGVSREKAKETERKVPVGEKSQEVAEHIGEEISLLRTSLEAKSTECNEYRDTLLRLQAEFENYRKRMVREQTQFLERAVERFVLELLPIIDNLERAIVAADEKHDLAQLSSGVSMVHSQIVDLFAKEGIEIIDPIGKRFDPTEQHAVLSVEDAEHDDDTVLEVLQKGYSLKGKIVRPAMVKVSKKPG